ncbi:MAG: LPS export ABC transporter periplasmic protein LptC [Xanthomonadaceae bacterium]|nr:LPS export ABC transporter periplasmic protein LptC [Xanthomonadaceae bacterium]
MERRLILIIAALAALALSTQILVWVFAPREAIPAFIGPPRSDYTLSDFSIDALDAQGRHSFSIAGPRLVRRAEDGSIFVTAPDYTILDDGRHTWKGTSDSAWVNKNGTLMKLEGKVEMHRLPAPGTAPAQLLTSDLTVTSPGKGQVLSSAQGKTMQTQALATITEPGRVVRGIGMQADLGLKTLQLLSAVHWTLLPVDHVKP